MTIYNHEFDATEFEADIYTRFPEYMHDYVELALFYHGAELQSAEITLREFAQEVSRFAVMEKEAAAKALQGEIMFEGVRQLVLEGKINDTQIVEELTEELRQGTGSLLARFISLQPVISPLDAVISFLAWKRARALVDLENLFDVNLDIFRDTRESECFCTSEGNMALANFSVLSQ